MTPLYIASFNNHYDIVLMLLNHGADPNKYDIERRTPLFIACLFEHIESIVYLIYNGADSSIVGDFGYTALHSVTKAGNLEIVKLLVKHGADLSIEDKQGLIPFEVAVREGHIKITEYLLNCGMNPNFKDEQGKVPLHHGSHLGNIEIVKLLVEHNSDLDIVNNIGETPIIKALRQKHVNIVIYLLEQGANPIQTAGTGHTIISRAIYVSADIVTFLLEKGINPNDDKVKIIECLLLYGANPESSFTTKDCNALYLAISSGNAEIVNLLLKHKANPNSCCKIMGFGEYFYNKPRSIFNFALVNGCINMLYSLINSGCDLTVTDLDKFYILQKLIKLDDSKLMKIVLDANFDINTRLANIGCSVLHHASKQGEYRTVKLLLECGANPNTTDKKRRTALHWAANHGHDDIVTILLMYGVDRTIIDKSERTALSRALRRKHHLITVILNTWPRVVTLQTLCLRQIYLHKLDVNNIPSGLLEFPAHN